MILEHYQILEEYVGLTQQAQAHVSRADYDAFQVFLRKIEIQAVQKRIHGRRSRAGAHARPLRANMVSPMAVRAALHLDRMISTRLAQAGALDDWEGHIERMAGIVGRWPPGSRPPFATDKLPLQY